MYEIGEGLTGTDQDAYVVAVTHVKIRSEWKDLFDEHVGNIEDSLQDQPGLVGYALRAAIPGRDRWTMTVWTDEQALIDFVGGPVHAAAMQDAYKVAESAETAHFTAKAEEIPVPWDDAIAALPEEAE
jgi:quinol monooxygenase YgiN